MDTSEERQINTSGSRRFSTEGVFHWDLSKPEEERDYFVMGIHHARIPTIGLCGGDGQLLTKQEAEKLQAACEMSTIAHSYYIFRWSEGVGHGH